MNSATIRSPFSVVISRPSDVGVFGFPGPVHHAAHHRHLHGLHARMAGFPFRHFFAQVSLNLVGHILKECAGGAAASRAGGHLRGETADPQRLQNLLRHNHFFGAVAVGQRRQRSADGVADSILQHRRQRRRGGHDPLAAHAGFGQTQVQRVVAHRRQRAVHVDQVLHAAHLRAEDDPVVTQPVPFGRLRRLHRARHHRIQRDLARVLGFRQKIILVHHARQQGRIERPPIDSDAHRLAVLRSHFDHRAEIVVGLPADVRIAGIDAILGQLAGALRILLEKDVAVVMEVADNRHRHAERRDGVDDFRHCRRGCLGVHRDAHQFRAGARQCHYLVHGGSYIGRVGVGHGLHGNRMIAAHLHTSHVHYDRLPAGRYCHEFSSWGEIQF